MKKSKWTSTFAWGIVTGLILAVAFINAGIDLRPYFWGIIITVFILALVIGIAVSLRQTNRQLLLLNQGRFEEAIEDLLAMDKKYSGQLGYKQQGLYGVANVYTRMGKFEESLTYLDKVDMDALDKNSKAGCYSLYAADLYFLERETSKAYYHIKKSREFVDMPESILLQALIELELNYTYEAGETIRYYEDTRNNKNYILGLTTVLIIDEFSKKISENFLLGTYYYRTGDFEKARVHLKIASDCNYENYNTAKARELLAEI